MKKRAKQRIIILVYLVLATGLFVENSVATRDQSADVLTEAEVASMIKPLIDEGLYVGVAIGLISRKGQAVYGFGSVRRGENVAPDRDTVFALASVTKVFTGTLLADIVLQGRIRLNEPIGPFLPASYRASRGSHKNYVSGSCHPYVRASTDGAEEGQNGRMDSQAAHDVAGNVYVSVHVQVAT